MGYFLECVDFINANFESIKEFVSSLPEEYCNLKDLISSSELMVQLSTVSNAINIAREIKYLETDHLTLKEQKEALFRVRESLNDPLIVERMDSIIRNNGNLNYYINLEVETTENKYLKFLNLTTVPVERSFSVLKHIQSEKRRCIKSENLFSYIVFPTNSK